MGAVVCSGFGWVTGFSGIIIFSCGFARGLSGVFFGGGRGIILVIRMGVGVLVGRCVWCGWFDVLIFGGMMPMFCFFSIGKGMVPKFSIRWWVSYSVLILVIWKLSM